MADPWVRDKAAALLREVGREAAIRLIWDQMGSLRFLAALHGEAKAAEYNAELNRMGALLAFLKGDA